jgi:carbonic anhydrase/acetyltransferase-like protein (isoleucine patch superfamily)
MIRFLKRLVGLKEVPQDASEARGKVLGNIYDPDRTPSLPPLAKPKPKSKLTPAPPVNKPFVSFVGNSYKPAQKRLLADFRNSPQDYIQHTNGGGWVHHTARVDATAYVPISSFVGPNSVVGPGVYMGRNVFIGENCVIGDGCHIGNSAQVEDACELGRNVLLGNPLYINSRSPKSWSTDTYTSGINLQPGTQIGDGAHIQDKATIGSNARIGSGVTLATRAYLGKQVQIGDNTHVAGCSIGDKTKIGKNVVLKESVGREALIGDYASVAFRSSYGRGSVPNYARISENAVYNNESDVIPQVMGRVGNLTPPTFNPRPVSMVTGLGRTQSPQPPQPGQSVSTEIGNLSDTRNGMGVEELAELQKKLEQVLPQLDPSQQRILGAIHKRIADSLKQQVAANPSAQAPIPLPTQTPPPQPQTPRPSMGGQVGDTLRAIRLGGKKKDNSQDKVR